MKLIDDRRKPIPFEQLETGEWFQPLNCEDVFVKISEETKGYNAFAPLMPKEMALQTFHQNSSVRFIETELHLIEG